MMRFEIDPFTGEPTFRPDPFVEEPSDLDIEIEELDFWNDDNDCLDDEDDEEIA